MAMMNTVCPTTTAADRIDLCVNPDYTTICVPSISISIEDLNTQKEEEPFMPATPVFAYALPEIQEVIFNEDAAVTVLLWKDGEKTIVRCGEGETFDRYTGFMAAICKRMFGGTTTAKKLMNAVDKKYQAKLKAEAAEKEKEKRRKEMEEAQAKAEKRREKEREELFCAMVDHFVLERAAREAADEIYEAEAEEAEDADLPFSDDDGAEE